MSDPTEPLESPDDDAEDEDLAGDLIALERETLADAIANLTERQSSPAVAEFLRWSFSAQSEVRGTEVGYYTLKEFRGAGTYGSVWRAIDRRTERTVALKVPHLNWKCESDIAERYAQEVEALARFRHTNVLPVREVVRESGWLALAMDYCEGPALDRWLSDRNEPPDPKVAAWIVKVLAEGVDTCHHNGIIHGDIKPANVLLFKPGGTEGFPYEPRLTDFGLAVLATESRRSGGSSMLGGTLEYMAPELFRGGAGVRNVATDVYALGVLLHVLLTGRTPFSGAAVGEVIARILDETPAPMSTKTRTVPVALERITRVCLAKSPGSRYRTAGDLARDLGAFLEEREVTARIEGLAMQWARRLRRRERVVEAGILILSIESALILWMWIATGMAAIGVRWLPAHMTTDRMLRDSLIMGAINLLPISMAIGLMRGHRWCALAAAVLCLASTVLSIGNLTGLIPPPFDGVYAADLKLQVVVFSLLTVLFAVQTAAALGAWWIMGSGDTDRGHRATVRS